MNSLPKFFNYKQEDTDNGYEAIQDFFMSWTLRCSVENYNHGNHKLLHQHSKNILCALLFGKNNSNGDYELKKPYPVITVKSVETKRQWKHIDLLAIINLEINGKNKTYILNIENKWYSSIRENQLQKSKTAVERAYSTPDNEIVNVILFCDYEKLDPLTYDFCQKESYKIVVIQDLFRLAEMEDLETGNYLFDEYWFNFSE